MLAKKGDILKGKKRNKLTAKHFIIFLSGDISDDFIGTILTHSCNDKYPDNIKMEATYFKKNSDDGLSYEVFYDDSYFIKRKFIKLKDWGPYKKVGQLSDDGIKFIESHILKSSPIPWEFYLKEIIT